MLDNDGRISDQGPKVIREKTRVALEVGEESGRVGVIVGI